MILHAWALLIRLLRVLRSAMASTASIVRAGPLYECWNKACPAYVGKGIYLSADDVWFADDNLIRCRHCQSYVLHKSEPDSTGTAVASGSAGAAVGAAAGAVVGGPVGALLGMVAAGALVAFVLSESQKRKRKPRTRARRGGNA